MENRELYEQKMQLKIRTLNAELDKLQARMEEAGVRAQLKTKGKFIDLKSKTQAANEKFEELKSAGDDAWGDVKNGFEDAWHSISKSVESARQQFK